jgi:hypothetical protein
MYSFFAFAFKVCKKCYDHKKLLGKQKTIWVQRKTQNFMLISNSLMPLLKMLLKKVKSKNYEKMRKNENNQNSHSFWLYLS